MNPLLLPAEEHTFVYAFLVLRYSLADDIVIPVVMYTDVARADQAAVRLNAEAHEMDNYFVRTVPLIGA